MILDREGPTTCYERVNSGHLTDRCRNRADEFPGPGMIQEVLRYHWLSSLRCSRPSRAAAEALARRRLSGRFPHGDLPRKLSGRSAVTTVRRRRGHRLTEPARSSGRSARPTIQAWNQIHVDRKVCYVHTLRDVNECAVHKIASCRHRIRRRAGRAPYKRRRKRQLGSAGCCPEYNIGAFATHTTASRLV